MREVHDAEHAEDDGQTEGGERVEPARRQALDGVLDKELIGQESLQEPSGAA